MSMKLRQIEHHLARAAYFRTLADARSKKPGPPGRMGEAAARRRAQEHEGKAAVMLAAGLRERAGLAQNSNARAQRRYTKRAYAGGPGRGRRKGSGWVSAGRGRGFVREDPDAQT